MGGLPLYRLKKKILRFICPKLRIPSRCNVLNTIVNFEVQIVALIWSNNLKNHIAVAQ